MVSHSRSRGPKHTRPKKSIRFMRRQQWKRLQQRLPQPDHWMWALLFIIAFILSNIWYRAFLKEEKLV